MSTPRKIFLSYAHEDLDYKNELVKHLSALRRQGLVDVWHDRMIPAGAEWDPAILGELESADLILLLVSSAFINSEYIWGKEISTAMARHEQRSATVIPVILKPCDWTKMPFSKLQGLPIGVKPISQWADRDEAFYQVVMGIRQVIERPLPFEGKTDAGGEARKQAPLPAIPDLAGLDYAHALRPEFTEHLLQTFFVRRQSVNLIAAAGAGEDRLVEDLRHCAVPDTRVLDVNVKNYVASYEGLLQDLAIQTGLPPAPRLAPFLSRAVDQLGQRLLLCLRHFDTLLDDPADLDSRYDVAFLNELNALRNRTDIRLLYHTRRPHNQCRFHGRGSWLTLELKPLPDLSAAQLAAEIDRRRPLTPPLRAYLVEQLETDPMPYTVLQRLLDLLTGENHLSRELLRDRLKQLHRELYGHGRR